MEARRLSLNIDHCIGAICMTGDQDEYLIGLMHKLNETSLSMQYGRNRQALVILISLDVKLNELLQYKMAI
jgi:hypothetical protein